MEKNHFGNRTSTLWHSSRDLACLALAVTLGLIVGWLDLHVTEVIVTIIALLTFGLLLGLVQPTGAWRWALLIAIGLPIMELIAKNFNLQTAEPVRFDISITIVALAFALLGTYLGVFIRYNLQGR